MKGFDCTNQLTVDKAKEFKADGFDFVARYVATSAWKCLSAQEVRNITDAGMLIVSIFESTADRAKGGYNAGLVDGQKAIVNQRVLGQPKGTPIYFAVDFEAGASDMPVIAQYLKGVSAAMGGFYEVGVYGSYSVIKYMQDNKACTRFWQTLAWSYGKKATGLHMYQSTNDTALNGLTVDLDDGFENMGGWNLNMLDKGVADTIINTWIGPSFAATQDINQKAYLHWLANQLRIASGQQPT